MLALNLQEMFQARTEMKFSVLEPSRRNLENIMFFKAVGGLIPSLSFLHKSSYSGMMESQYSKCFSSANLHQKPFNFSEMIE